MNKQGLVYCIQPEQYEIFDDRIKKPICFKSIENGIEKGSMIFQELDEVNFKKNPLTYFPPNNVGLLLSISKRHLSEARELFKKEIDPNVVNHSYVETTQNTNEFLINKSKIIADFIETIQICIVFGYTALDAFTNLSITENYEYKVNVKNKGIIELYDKKAIERWIGLSDKVSKILTEIYKTKKIETTKFWSYFIKLENYRHDIIHQKSIEKTEFYKNYFNKDIFEVCSCPELVLKFFYESQSSKQRTNPLWPWLINKEKEFPISTDFNSQNFEVIGNLYEGKKK
ncbi:MAG: hypothetical protein HZB41_05065 [Ignavibacteriae bacterium]|nr:hypothetical protein [Ignavibacteriota bacterium]